MPEKLKKIDVLNDYLAILLTPPKSALELPEETLAKMNNEGIIVGVGPDVNKGPNREYTGDDKINLGDHVAIRSNKYTMIEAQHGCYAKKKIVLVHKPDLVYRHTKHDPKTYEFVEVWDAEDHAEATKANV